MFEQAGCAAAPAHRPCHVLRDANITFFAVFFCIVYLCVAVCSILRTNTPRRPHIHFGRRGHAFKARQSQDIHLSLFGQCLPSSAPMRRAFDPRNSNEGRTAAKAANKSDRIPAAAATRRRCVASLLPLSYAAPPRACTATPTTTAAQQGRHSFMSKCLADGVSERPTAPLFFPKKKLDAAIFFGSYGIFFHRPLFFFPQASIRHDAPRGKEVGEGDWGRPRPCRACGEESV